MRSQSLGAASPVLQIDRGARRNDARGAPAKEIRTFGTLTSELLALADWLDAAGVTAVAMESTGSYWKPIWNLLEDCFELLLANAAHLKAVPGRKTDVRNAEWIADLFRHGLLRASFNPPRPERELRELVRYRTTLVRERASEINRDHERVRRRLTRRLELLGYAVTLRPDAA